jgi:hypothetical protein
LKLSRWMRRPVTAPSSAVRDPGDLRNVLEEMRDGIMRRCEAAHEEQNRQAAHGMRHNRYAQRIAESATARLV